MGTKSDDGRRLQLDEVSEGWWGSGDCDSLVVQDARKYGQYQHVHKEMYASG